jgi:hypothetical protein
MGHGEPLPEQIPGQTDMLHALAEIDGQSDQEAP